jgi:hypothetical protein
LAPPHTIGASTFTPRARVFDKLFAAATPATARAADLPGLAAAACAIAFTPRAVR